MNRLFLLLILLFAVAAARAQDASSGASAAPSASTTPAPGTQPSSGAPTIANPAPGPQQPIAFNHKLHVETAKLACKDCHQPSRSGDTLAIPQPTQCMLCHAAIATDKPEIKRLADMAKNNQTAAWVRVYRVPSFVQFSHGTHTGAGATCEDCHGPVAQRTSIALEKDLSMGGCIACHTARNAPIGCETCHELQAKNPRQPAFGADSALVALLTRRSAGEPAGVSVMSIHRFLRPLNAPRISAAALF